MKRYTKFLLLEEQGSHLVTEMDGTVTPCPASLLLINAGCAAKIPDALRILPMQLALSVYMSLEKI